MFQLEVGSDNDDNSSDEALSVDKTRPASLDKMIALVASLVERSRGQDLRLKLSPKDYNAIAGGKVRSFNSQIKYKCLLVYGRFFCLGLPISVSTN